MFLNSVASATITLQKINETVLYQSELLSSNGTIFHPYDINTILSFHVYKGLDNITNSIEHIEWVKYSFDADLYFEDKIWGQDYKDLSSIEINKSEINKKCIIQANALVTINGRLECVASSRITLIDVNELYSSNEPPINPNDGQLWVDTSKNIPVIYSWNALGNKWSVVGQTTPFVRNLIQNSNFWKLNTTDYSEENPEYLNNLIVTENFNKKWLRMKSKKPTDSLNMTAGIYQNTQYPVQKESDYVFSFLAYCVNEVGYNGTSMYVKISSLNSDNISTTLFNKVISIYGEQYESITCKVTTLSDTEKIQILLGVDPMEYCEFYITELSLYNTSSYYPWELSPEDSQQQINKKLDNDHLSVFNALTRNGKMEGIYIDTDENGIEHYYFNASHLKAGSIDGGLINGIGIDIKDKDGQSIFHVYEGDNGQTYIDMIANNLSIGTKSVTTEDVLESSLGALETTTLETVQTKLQEQASQNKEILELAIIASEINTKQYVDSTIEKLADNTSGLIQESITSSNSYTDSNIQELSGQVSTLQEAIDLTYTNSKSYTDGKVSAIINAHDQSIISLQKAISLEIDTDISTAKKSTLEYVDGVKQALQGKIDEKTDSSVVSSLSGEVSTIKSDLSGVKNSLSNKADKTTLSNLSTEVGEMKKSLSDKADKSTVDTLSSNVSGLTSSLNNKADKTTVDTLSSNVSDLTSSLSDKADKATVIQSINATTETLKIKETLLDLTNTTKTITLLMERIEALEEIIRGSEEGGE